MNDLQRRQLLVLAAGAAGAAWGSAARAQPTARLQSWPLGTP
jgi:hypothetical protein